MSFESFIHGSRKGAHTQRFAIGLSTAACVLVAIGLVGQRVKAAPPPEEKKDEAVDVKFTEEIPEEKPKDEPPPPPDPSPEPAPAIVTHVKPIAAPPPAPEVPTEIPKGPLGEDDPSKDKGAPGSPSGEPGGNGTGGGGAPPKPVIKEPPPPPPPPVAPPAPKPVAKEAEPGDTPAKAMSASPPAYPDAARAAGIEGVVIVKLTIDENGSVTSAKILKGDPNFDEVVMKTVLGWKYHPAKHADGTPYASTKTVKIPFRIKS